MVCKQSSLPAAGCPWVAFVIHWFPCTRHSKDSQEDTASPPPVKMFEMQTLKLYHSTANPDNASLHDSQESLTYTQVEHSIALMNTKYVE